MAQSDIAALKCYCKSITDGLLTFMSLHVDNSPSSHISKPEKKKGQKPMPMFNSADLKMSELSSLVVHCIGKLYEKMSSAGDHRLMVKHLRSPWTWWDF